MAPIFDEESVAGENGGGIEWPFMYHKNPMTFQFPPFRKGPIAFTMAPMSITAHEEPAALTVHEKPVLEQDIATSLWLITVPLSQGSRGLSLFMQNLWMFIFHEGPIAGENITRNL